MFIDNLGIAHENVVHIPDDAVLEECYKVRVLKPTKDFRYAVMGEEFYPAYPTDDQIMWCIAHYKGSQAVVEKVHWIEKIPFAEGNNE
jgi:hypothetical protein